jgi:hypothetical protein
LKKWIAYFICLIFFLIVGFNLFKNSDYQTPKSEQAVNKILNQTANILKHRYNMKPIATNVAMPGGIVKLLGLDFQLLGPLEKEKIRNILIDSAQELLKNINADAEIRPYLESYPFTIQNVEINLFLIDAKGSEINHPDIGIAGIAEGELDYLTLLYTDIPNQVTESKESYKDALDILEKKNIKN